jgi:hypothetical protein
LQHHTERDDDDDDWSAPTINAIDPAEAAAGKKQTRAARAVKEASGTEPVPTGEVGVADGNIVDAEFSTEEVDVAAAGVGEDEPPM